MIGLIFCPDIDYPGEGNGSTEFSSQAKMLKALKGGTIVSFDNEDPHMPNRAAQVLAALKAQPAASLDFVSFVCHGWGRGIQAGFDIRGGIKGTLPELLATEIARVAKPGPFVIPLYCCSTGEDNVNGFAAVLQRELLVHGCQAVVFAHTTAGHTTRNPHVRVFGHGEWLIDPADAHYWHRWVVRMIDPHEKTGLRFRFPWMTRAALLAELG